MERVAERGDSQLAAAWNRNVGRRAVIVVEVGAAVGLGRMFVLGLERCCRDVRLVGVGTFLCRHGVIDSTRAAAIRDMVVVNDGGVVNNRLVAIYRIAGPIRRRHLRAQPRRYRQRLRRATCRPQNRYPCSRSRS